MMGKYVNDSAVAVAGACCRDAAVGITLNCGCAGRTLVTESL